MHHDIMADLPFRHRTGPDPKHPMREKAHHG